MKQMGRWEVGGGCLLWLDTPATFSLGMGVRGRRWGWEEVIKVEWVGGCGIYGCAIKRGKK